MTERKISTFIPEWWSDHYKAVASCQLDHNGIIFLDDHDYPIENQLEVWKLFETFVNGAGNLAYNSRFYLSMKQLGFVDDYADFEKEAHNFIFMDDVYSLESVGRHYFIMSLKPEMHNFDFFEKYINFKHIGENLLFDNLTLCGFAKYGFILHR